MMSPIFWDFFTPPSPLLLILLKKAYGVTSPFGRCPSPLSGWRHLWMAPKNNNAGQKSNWPCKSLLHSLLLQFDKLENNKTFFLSLFLSGLALGMITLGQGESLQNASLNDLNLPESLYYHMVGGPRPVSNFKFTKKKQLISISRKIIF